MIWGKLLNYFDNKFQYFNTEHDFDSAVMKTTEVLLFQSAQLKIKEYANKFSAFWHAEFIQQLDGTHLQCQNMRWALGQYFRKSEIDEAVITRLMHLDIKSVIAGLRLSGLITRPSHEAWHAIRSLLLKINHQGLNQFLVVVDKMHEQYKVRVEARVQLQTELGLSQLHAMIFSSLYAYEYLVSPNQQILNIPYQVDGNDTYSVEDVYWVLDTIIRSAKPNKTSVNEQVIGLAIKKKLVPFLFSDGMNEVLARQYEEFKELVAIQLEIYHYENFVLGAYSYQLETDYRLVNNQLMLRTIGNSKHESELWADKFVIVQTYWTERGVEAFEASGMMSRIAQNENYQGNIEAMVQAFSVTEQILACYGISTIEVDGLRLNVLDTAKTLALSKMHYQQEHIQPFLDFEEDISVFHKLAVLAIEGIEKGENRLPFTFGKIQDKAIRMGNWIDAASVEKAQDVMRDILYFWSHDLSKPIHYRNSTVTEKPFYRVDGYCFQLPWLTAYQNLNTCLINHMRKLHTNRAELFHETSCMELQLAQLFKQAGFEVYPQYAVNDMSGVGEIDLIATYKNHVIVIELKSSFIKKTIREIYEYRHFVLNKAAYQLDKKSCYVKNHIQEIAKLNETDVCMHSWIVDTTLEFDHQVFNKHLKLSIDELFIVLGGSSDFLEKRLEQHTNSILSEDGAVRLSKDFISPLHIIELIESNQFWKQILSDAKAYEFEMGLAVHKQK